MDFYIWTNPIFCVISYEMMNQIEWEFQYPKYPISPDWFFIVHIDIIIFINMPHML